MESAEVVKATTPSKINAAINDIDNQIERLVNAVSSVVDITRPIAYYGPEADSVPLDTVPEAASDLVNILRGMASRIELQANTLLSLHDRIEL